MLGAFSLLFAEKKMQNLKFENFVLFGGQIEYLSSRVSPSDSSEGLLQRTKGGRRQEI